MIPPELADVLRYVDAGLALLLIVASGWSVVLAEHWDQRVLFGIFAAFGFLLTGGHLSTLGQASSWRLAVLIIVVAVALASTIANIRRELRDREARDRRSAP